MTYRIRGLEPGQFDKFFVMKDSELAGHRARKTFAERTGRYPCRVSLQDAEPGEELLLVNHVNHDVETPYRNAFAIFVRKGAAMAEYIDALPPVLENRPIALRGYDRQGNLVEAALAMVGQVDSQIRALLSIDALSYIDAHNAAHGCFAARVERYD